MTEDTAPKILLNIILFQLQHAVHLKNLAVVMLVDTKTLKIIRSLIVLQKINKTSKRRERKNEMRVSTDINNKHLSFIIHEANNCILFFNTY